MSSFRDSGVGSRAWYILKFKENPDRKGFTFLKDLSKDEGRTLQFDEFQTAVQELAAGGWLKKIGKPDAPRSDRYEVTSFGHRYLEEHKDEIGAPEPKYEKRSDGYYYKDGKMISRLMIPKHKLDELDGNVNGPVRVVKPAAPVPAHVPAKSVIIPPAPVRINKGPEPTPISEDPRINKEPASDSEIPNNSSEPSLLDQLKLVAGEILVERHAGMITVKDVIEHLEKKS